MNQEGSLFFPSYLKEGSKADLHLSSILIILALLSQGNVHEYDMSMMQSDKRAQGELSIITYINRLNSPAIRTLSSTTSRQWQYKARPNPLQSYSNIETNKHNQNATTPLCCFSNERHQNNRNGRDLRRYFKSPTTLVPKPR